MVNIEDFILKLRKRNYFTQVNTMQILVQIGSRGFLPKQVKCNASMTFYHDCPVFFWVTRPDRTAEQVCTFYDSNDAFPCKKIPFRGYDDD